ncbi:MAG: AI-2E family transporter [Acidobacteria bacterium]|jgi:predicted PurR-regulated permease PerM|nr:AI-2E family transporter [Acidobacteriota bacterium]
MSLSVKPKQSFIKRVLIVVGIITFVIVFALLFVNAITAFLLAFTAILFAVFLRGLSDWLSEYTGIPSGWSLVIVSILLISIIGAAVWWQAPVVIEQVRDLRSSLPAAYENLKEQVAQYSWGLALLEQIPDLDAIFTPSGQISSISSRFFTSTLSILGNLLAVGLLGIYLAVEPKIYARGVAHLFPDSKRERISEVLVKISQSLRWWLVGRVFAMFIIGIFSTVGLMYLGVPLAVALGLIAAVLNFIPNFGPIIALIPASLLALTISPMTVVYVIALFTVVQILESYLITPMIDRKTVSMPPAITIFSQIFMGYLLGILGLVLATPMVLVSIILIQNLYVEDVLGGKTDNEFSTKSMDEKADKTVEEIKV